MPTTCPKCRRVQYYVCGNKECRCYSAIPAGKKPMRRLKHDGLACPYCGFAEHIDYWVERDMRNAQTDQPPLMKAGMYR